MGNFNADSMINSIRTQISSVNSDHLREVFKEVQIVAGYKQPKNLRGLLTHAKFGAKNINSGNVIMPGIFAECTDIRCQLCSLDYVQSCSSFLTSSGVTWHIKSHINCNSYNVAYFLKCNMCNGLVTYTGITEMTLRTRTNNHISCCRKGTGRNIFDNHVFECGTKNGHRICIYETHY